MIRCFTIILFSLASFSICQAQVNDKPVFETESTSLKTLFAARKYTEALKLVNRLISDNPEKGINYFSKAIINYYNNKSTIEVDTSIIQDCHRAINLSYDNPEVNYLLFLIYLQNIDVLKEGFLSYGDGNTSYGEVQINFSKTKEQIDIAIKKKPENEKFLAARIQLLQKIFYPNGHEIKQEDFITFKTDCNHILYFAKNRKNKANAYYQLSQIELYKYEDTLKAISYMTNALEAMPNNLLLYLRRADLKSKLQNYQGAISDYSTYLINEKSVDNYSDGEIYEDRGGCYYELNKFSSAITDFTMAIAMLEKEKTITQNKSNYYETKLSIINNHLQSLYFNRGLSYLMLKNNLKACVDFNKAMDYGSTEASEIIKNVCK